eukprot:COSAG03_NODE_449_length_7834_cov_7.818746_5_plen_65_part_00
MLVLHLAVLVLHCRVELLYALFRWTEDVGTELGRGVVANLPLFPPGLGSRLALREARYSRVSHV